MDDERITLDGMIIDDAVDFTDNPFWTPENSLEEKTTNFNPKHDKMGRFAEGGGTGPDTPTETAVVDKKSGYTTVNGVKVHNELKAAAQDAVKIATYPEFSQKYEARHLVDLSDPANHRIGRLFSDTGEGIQDAFDMAEEYGSRGIGQYKYEPNANVPDVTSPTEKVTIYRGTVAAQKKMEVGDFVSFSKSYAASHNEGRKMLELTVPAHDVIWQGNDLTEWVYSPKAVRGHFTSLEDFYTQVHNGVKNALTGKVENFNPNHDKAGRFAEGGSDSVNTSTGADIESDLRKEAGKYGSAQEFINSIPLVYHGSGQALDHFTNDTGTFFTDDYMNADGYAGGEYVYEGHLYLRNPVVINARGRKWDNLQTKYGSSTQQVVGTVDSSKHDGVIFQNVRDSWIDDAEAQDPGTVYYAYTPADSFFNEDQLSEIYTQAHAKNSLDKTDNFNDKHDKLGRFAEGGTGSAKIVKGKKLKEDDFMSMWGNIDTEDSGDEQARKLLEAVYDKQGYNAKPTLLSDEEFKGIDSQILYRGLIEHDGNGTYNKQFKTGNTHYPGIGIYGNGTYVSDKPGTAALYSSSGRLLQMKLKPGSKVASFMKVIHEAGAVANKMNDKADKLLTSQNEEERFLGYKYRTMSHLVMDPGVYAASQGYDALDVDSPGMNQAQSVIFNRSALYVNESDYQSNQGEMQA